MDRGTFVDHTFPCCRNIGPSLHRLLSPASHFQHTRDILEGGSSTFRKSWRGRVKRQEPADAGNPVMAFIFLIPLKASRTERYALN
ncbi:hypothetical protein SAMN03159463_02641 [Mesorhizobium sp. NFR06]|nr:hypothetical protein SAMN03159463_02641 [Mesorhizobium sp. NFR06]